MELVKPPNNEAVLCNWRFIDPNNDYLKGIAWWCKDAEDTSAIAINTFCKSAIASWKDIGEWDEFFLQYQFIVIAIPPGPEQTETINELSSRLSIPLEVPNANSFKGQKSITDLINEFGGEKSLNSLLYNLEEVERPGLINFSEIDLSNKTERKSITSGFSYLDRAIGGFANGELSIWTGKRGGGKSTLLGQITLEAVEQGHKVCVYSGELRKEKWKSDLLQQAAGTRWNIDTIIPITKKKVYVVDSKAAEAINKWCDLNLFLTDINFKNAHNEDTIIKNFEYAHRRYGCDVFLVDNIMTAQLKNEDRLGYYRAQSIFTGSLVEFSKRLDVHVHLVAHPKKTGDRRNLESDDVSGTGEITNRADNVFSVVRLSPEQEQREGYSTLLSVLKNREYGSMEKIRLKFEESCRRFYQVGNDPFKMYQWERDMTYGGKNRR